MLSVPMSSILLRGAATYKLWVKRSNSASYHGAAACSVPERERQAAASTQRKTWAAESVLKRQKKVEVEGGVGAQELQV
jgi:hypothetical protein